MMDSRIEKLANILVTFSTEVKPGENVLISSGNGNDMLVKALVREVYKAGGRPFVWLQMPRLSGSLAWGIPKTS